jgi:hypothetical protein
MAATIKLIGITTTGMEGFGMVGTGIQVIGILAQSSSWRRIKELGERNLMVRKKHRPEQLPIASALYPPTCR